MTIKGIVDFHIERLERTIKEGQSTGQTVQVHLRLPREVVAQLDVITSTLCISRNAFLGEVVEDVIEESSLAILDGADPEFAMQFKAAMVAAINGEKEPQDDLYLAASKALGVDVGELK